MGKPIFFLLLFTILTYHNSHSQNFPSSVESSPISLMDEVLYKQIEIFIDSTYKSLPVFCDHGVVSVKVLQKNDTVMVFSLYHEFLKEWIKNNPPIAYSFCGKRPVLFYLRAGDHIIMNKRGHEKLMQLIEPWFVDKRDPASRNYPLETFYTDRKVMKIYINADRRIPPLVTYAYR